ncbi:MAG: ABC transporter permease subunit [Gammaproteobacteria bacterium]|jgi:ABC-type nitrate/sulfonate/bicarbonate transport system permease component|nr:ABC transporter permease subunit [Gammaproteobacteria bacterium]
MPDPANNSEILRALKSAMPFQMVPDNLIQEIAGICTQQSYDSGQKIYDLGDVADDVFIVVSGSVQHVLSTQTDAGKHEKTMRGGDVFGWAAVLEGQSTRLAVTVSIEPTQVLRINGKGLIQVFKSEPAVGDVVMTRFATLINREFYVPRSIADQVPSFKQALGASSLQGSEVTTMALTVYRISTWIKSPRPYLMLIGFAFFLGFWMLSVEVWQLPRFVDMPGPTEVFTEWFSEDPYYGLSVYTPEYYKHIGISLRRIAFAFFLATGLGVPLGLFLGWSKTFREFIFPLFEVLRPIPVLAWVPLAIIIFSGSETPVVFLTFLASFFATTLNTMLGVESIDESYSRAAYCLGASRWQTFVHVVIPGAMPYIFTGLQISIGVAWFSLVAGEMVSGQYGLGYVINTAYMMIEYPKIIIGMITLGVVGYTTSAMVRMMGDYLMQWRVRELALGDN